MNEPCECQFYISRVGHSAADSSTHRAQATLAQHGLQCTQTHMDWKRLGEVFVDPLWALCSGKFAGWRNGNTLYNANGNNVGYFSEDVAYSLNGNYIGEMYNKDRIGKRSTASHVGRVGRVGTIGIATAPRADRGAMGVAGWEDPDF
jgi:hypothetical protein